MDSLFEKIREHASLFPGAPAIRDECISLAYGALQSELEWLQRKLPAGRIGLLLGNGAHWACIDLALMRTGSVCVPLPLFFSDAQLAHVIDTAGLDWIISDQAIRAGMLCGRPEEARLAVAGREVLLFRPQHKHAAPVLPPATIKLTFTSGTTGQPKGVCLSAATIENVLTALCDAAQAASTDRALSLLPLSTLLENIAGIYAPLWSGACAQVPDLHSCGLSGQEGLNVSRLFEAMKTYSPTTLVLVPQLLKAVIGGLLSGLRLPAQLRFVALGGAPVPHQLLRAAEAMGLPVYQGYGLSEAGSVVSLNTPLASRTGSVGKPLPHVRVEIAEDGEIVVAGELFSAYLGMEAPLRHRAWHTGDIGHFDQDGYLYLTGRKKTAYATAHGRNVSPEWVESELAGCPFVLQAAVFGEARPFNVAVLVVRPGVPADELAQAIASVNASLPDYAGVRQWLIATEAFTAANGLCSTTGAIRREQIGHRYQDQIESLYANQEEHVFL